VRDAVAPERVENWRKLQREVRRDTLNALERQQMLGQWKARSRLARIHQRAKRSGDD
jgi:ribosome biogenesis GTPase